MTDLDRILRSRDTTLVQAGQRVVWRQRGTADMFVGTIEVVDGQKPYPVLVALDNGETAFALVDELEPFPQITDAQVDDLLAED